MAIAMNLAPAESLRPRSAVVARPRLVVVAGAEQLAPRRFSWRYAVAVTFVSLALAVGFAKAPDLPGDVVAAPNAAVVDPTQVLLGGESYVVQPGDSYWAIARRLTPAGTSGLVDRMVADNGGAQLSVGQVILLPVP